MSKSAEVVVRDIFDSRKGQGEEDAGDRAGSLTRKSSEVNRVKGQRCPKVDPRNTVIRSCVCYASGSLTKTSNRYM